MRKIMMAWAAIGALLITAPAHAATLNLTLDTVDQVNGYDITLTGLNTDGSDIGTSLGSGTITGFGTFSFLTGALSLVAPGTSGLPFAWDGVVTAASPFFSNTASSGIVLQDTAGNFFNPYNLSGTLFDSVDVGGGASNPGDLINVATFQTPLPAALPLFASGLGALGFFGRRKKQKASVTA